MQENFMIFAKIKRYSRNFPARQYFLTKEGDRFAKFSCREPPDAAI